MTYVAVGVAWLVVGAVVGVIDARHGHWHRGWVLSAILGPLAVVFILARARAARPAATVLSIGRARHGQLDLLIGFDGSAASMAAATRAIELFGPRARKVTLATVLDVDTAAPHTDSILYPEPWPEERTARDDLETAVSTIATNLGVDAGSVIVSGAPAAALEHYAVDEGYDVLVVGCRGRGVSKLLFGSCASTLAGGTNVPVMIIPTAPAPPPSTAHCTTEAGHGNWDPPLQQQEEEQ